MAGQQARLLGQVHGLDTHAVAALLPVLLRIGALAVAVFGNGQHLLPGQKHGHVDQLVVLLQLHGLHAHAGAANDANGALLEAQRPSVAAGNDQAHAAVGQVDGDQLVVLPQRQGDQARLAQVGKLAVGRALDHALAGHHDQIMILRVLGHRDHGRDLLVAGHLQQVYNGHAAGRASRLGDLVALQGVDPAPVGEEHDVLVGVDDDQPLHEVLVPGGHAADALAAPVLRPVGALGQTLHIAEVGHGDHHVVGLDQVFNVDLAFQMGQLGAALVGEFVADVAHFLLDDAHEQGLVVQQALQIGDGLFQLLIFLQQPLPFQTGQAGQTHVQNGLRLLVAEGEGLHQARPGRVGIRALLDDLDDFVDVIQRLQQALQNVGPGQRLVQVVLGAAGHDFLLMADVVIDHLPQVQHLGLAVHQRQHVGAEGLLHGGVLVEVIEDDLRMNVLLQLNDDAHAVAVALVADVGNAVQPLLMHQLGNALHQLGLVDHVGDLRHHDAAAVLAHGLDLRPGPHQNAAAAGVIGGAHAGHAQNDAAGGEVRPLDELHQIIHRAVRVIDHINAGVYRLPQIVRRNVGGHAHGNAVGAVHQQVGVTAGQNAGLQKRLVKVGIEVYRILVDLSQQGQGQLGHAGFRVTHGGCAVAVHGAEVALTVHQRIADVEILRQTHHGVVYAAVAVGMVFAQHVAHDTGALAVGFVRGHAQLVHGVQNAPVDGLQTVAHVGQGPADDNGHGIADKGFFQLMLKVGGDQFVANRRCHSFPSLANPWFPPFGEKQRRRQKSLMNASKRSWNGLQKTACCLPGTPALPVKPHFPLPDPRAVAPVVPRQ